MLVLFIFVTFSFLLIRESYMKFVKRSFFCLTIAFSFYGHINAQELQARNQEMVSSETESGEFDLFAESDTPEPTIPPMAPPSKIKTYVALALMKTWLLWRTATDYAKQMNILFEQYMYKPVRYFLECPHEKQEQHR